MGEPDKPGSSADRERLIGMLVAFAIIVVVAAGLMAVFGVPARQDCTYEHYGKGSFSASCVQHARVHG
jgi:hypothetical protein